MFTIKASNFISCTDTDRKLILESILDDYDLRICFKNEKTGLSLVGFYPQRTAEYKYLYFISAFFTITMGCTSFISMLTQIIIDIKDLSKVSETLLFFITHSTYMCKMVNFLFYKTNLLEIEDNLARPVFYSFKKDRLKVLEKRIKDAQVVVNTYKSMCVVAVFMYGFMPYLDKNKKSSLPLPGWQPYDATKYARYYYPTAVFQVISLCYTATNNVHFDCLTWMLVSLASGEFDILMENLKTIDYEKEGVEDEFKRCVNHHREIVNFVHKIESTFSKGIFLTFLASVVVICFTGFTMLIVPFLGMQFIFLALYLMCMMTEVAAYCWFGHIVMTTSEQIGTSFYMSNWYMSKFSVRESLSIFLERTKKPVTLTGGKLVVLSLPTFTGILRSSYSYFAVLQRLYKDS